jgi:hypothetical protein
MELHRITEWRDGCVFKTEKQFEVWAPSGLRLADPNAVLVSLSTSRMKALGYQTVRTVADTAPDMEPA